MNDDLTLLASAYLDGEATPDERARVEADPSLLGEVERLRAARVTMLDAKWFEPPGDDVREAAIAAALSAWDATAGGLTDSRTDTRPAGRRPPHVLSFERRRPYTRWLSAAAALVAVAAFGVVISRSGGGSDDDTSSLAVEAPAATAAGGALFGTAEQPEQTAAPGDAGRTATADDSGGAGPASEAAEQAPSAPAETEAPAATEAAAAAGDVASAPTAIAVMQTPQDLAAVAADAKSAVESGTNRDVLAPPCSDDAFDDIDAYVAMGTYRDRSVVVGIDDEDDRAIAIDPDACEIVAEAPLP